MKTLLYSLCYSVIIFFGLLGIKNEMSTEKKYKQALDKAINIENKLDSIKRVNIDKKVYFEN